MENISFKEFLQESLSKSVLWKWITKASDLWKAEFFIDNKKYQVVFESEDSENWELIFALRFNGKLSVKLTNTGDAFIVFGTVKEIFNDWLKKNSKNMMSIKFTADEKSRKKLYFRLVKMISKEHKLNYYEAEPGEYILEP